MGQPHYITFMKREFWSPYLFIYLFRTHCTVETTISHLQMETQKKKKKKKKKYLHNYRRVIITHCIYMIT